MCAMTGLKKFPARFEQIDRKQGEVFNFSQHI
jgi:hypothetical protein